MKNFTLFLFSLVYSTIISHAQYQLPSHEDLFMDDEVPRIDIHIAEEDLVKLYEDVEGDEEFRSTFIYSHTSGVDTIHDVGFRLRGNTSRYAEKKSFKVSFNTFEAGAKFKGVEKLNLNGEHNDPSIIRSKLCLDLCRFLEIPASRSNHVALYINQAYYGLYTNVEHIDEEFIKKRFANEVGNLWKCLYPADLVFKGEDPELYKEEFWGRRAYDLKTNQAVDDYSKLAEFIKILNTNQGEGFKCKIEEVFDVESYLKAAVMDILTSNWDGPIVNKNNFYLYHDLESDKIVYLPYDLDNTFGIDWLGVDWVNTDLYAWHETSNEQRPIFSRFMEFDEYKDRFSFYMDQAIQQFFNIETFEDYIADKKEMVEPYRQNDDFASKDYGWEMEDFSTSYIDALGGHVSYGLYPYITQRTQTIQEQINVQPIQSNIRLQTGKINGSEAVFDLILTTDGVAPESYFIYTINGGEIQQIAIEWDDDKSSIIVPVDEAGLMQYYVSCTGLSGEVLRFPRCNDLEVNVGFLPVDDLVINELMASNSESYADESGEFDDWLEIYNNGETEVNLGDLHLSDDIEEPFKWSLPNKTLGPDEYIILWVDSDEDQGDHHANFKLRKEGEFIGLFDSEANNFAPIDTFNYGEQETDKSFARLPNAVGDFTITEDFTPGINNEEMFIAVDDKYQYQNMYPNPGKGQIFLELNHPIREYNIKAYSSKGIQVPFTTEDRSINLESNEPGIYFIQWTRGSEKGNGKYILIE